MKRSKFSIYSATLVLAVSVTVPFATALLKGTEASHYSATLQEQAGENLPGLRATRRALTRLNARCGRDGEKQDAVCQAHTIVQKECLARQDEYFLDTGCPTINDMVRVTQIQKALERGDPVPALQGASLYQSSAPASSGAGQASSAAEHAVASGASLKDLSPSDQNAVRRAIRVKNCSSKLPQAMYLICSAIVGENQQAAPMGLTNDLAKIQSERASKTPATINDRIKMTVPVKR